MAVGVAGQEGDPLDPLLVEIVGGICSAASYANDLDVGDVFRLIVENESHLKFPLQQLFAKAACPALRFL